MQTELSRAEDLHKVVTQATVMLDIAHLEAKLRQLKQESEASTFWQNHQTAQATMKEIADLEKRILPWRQLSRATDDLLELVKMNDETMRQELATQLADLEGQFETLRGQLRFSGPYDEHDVILSIYAGAGGTDAQDWAQMLLRMYIRWAEKHHFRFFTYQESPGDEAGLKSITIEIDGEFVYGKLQGEHGVHRLVRLSPFNADNLRQTSFARVEVMPKIDKPDEVTINDNDLKVDVFRSGGHGGQSVNTTDSAVRITHLPTGITVSIQNERSQLQNRTTAMTILYSRLAQLQLEQHVERVSELKGPNEQAAWGNQIRSYVLHPYKQVKDLRTQYETSDVEGVLNGDIEGLIEAYLDHKLKQTS